MSSKCAIHAPAGQACVSRARCHQPTLLLKKGLSANVKVSLKLPASSPVIGVERTSIR